MAAVIYILSVKYSDDLHVLLYNLFLVMLSEFSPVKNFRTHQKTEKSRPRFHHFLISTYVGSGMAHESTKKRGISDYKLITRRHWRFRSEDAHVST